MTPVVVDERDFIESRNLRSGEENGGSVRSASLYRRPRPTRARDAGTCSTAGRKTRRRGRALRNRRRNTADDTAGVGAQKICLGESRAVPLQLDIEIILERQRDGIAAATGTAVRREAAPPDGPNSTD